MSQDSSTIPSPSAPQSQPTPRNPRQQDSTQAAPRRATRERSAVTAGESTPAGPSRFGWLKNKDFWQGGSACTISMLVHTLVLVLLGIFVLPGGPLTKRIDMTAPLAVEEQLEEFSIELEESTQPSEDPMIDHSGGAVAGLPAGLAVLSSAQPALDREVMEDAIEYEMSLEFAPVSLPTHEVLSTDVPKGTRGDARVVVDGVGQAMSRITRELQMMLEKRDVLVVWVFDQSGSMENDQKEVRDRIEQVYQELGVRPEGRNGRLTSSIVSYGARFQDNNERGPTSDINKIREAIDAIEVDESGKEYMCSAIAKSVDLHTRYCLRQDRQMVLILVSDESGEPEEHYQALESTIAHVQSADAKLYVLGREAVFGYPHVYMRWVHPQTDRVHWLQVDRGPESAFAETLQIDGFRRRYDGFSSGFGPYSQTRLASETGGIFFMLPSVEQDAVAAQKRRYDLESMRPYRPDLRARSTLILERDKYPLRTLLWQVVQELNPLDPNDPSKAQRLELAMTYSNDPAVMVTQIRSNLTKTQNLLAALKLVRGMLEDQVVYREQEVNPRWQANYDLMYAQVVTFQCRVYEYAAYMNYYMANPREVPLVKENGQMLQWWNVGTRSKTLADDESIDYPNREAMLENRELSIKLLNQVIADHPGTPWAERAHWELRRGYGVYVSPYYRVPFREIPANVPPVPIPKI